VIPIVIVLCLFAYGYHWYYYSYSNSFVAVIEYKYISINESRVVMANASTTSPDALKTVQLITEDTLGSTANASGQKIVGDKASGSVSIINPTTQARVIPASTVLTCFSTACNGLSFTTTTDVSIAPGGFGEARVVANDMGDNYNIAPGQRFKVGKFDPNEVLASNNKAFSGGTPKRILKIVAQADIKNAEDTALTNLKTRLADKIANEPANNQYEIAASSIQVEKISTESDVQVGQEAEIVNVTVKAKGTVQALPKEQITAQVQSIRAEVTPEGYYLDEKSIAKGYTITKQTKDSIEITMTFAAIARPTIDTAGIKEKLKGKPYGEAPAILDTIPNIKSYRTDFDPKTLPQFFWKIPDNTNRIFINLNAVKE